MMIKRSGRRVLSLLLAVLLPFTAWPFFAAAESDRPVIASFAQPVIHHTVEAGTEREAIPLPQALEAELEDGSTEEIPVQWSDGGLYDKDVKGEYAFTADIGVSYIYAQPRPIAVVTVAQESKSIESFAQPVTEITVAVYTELADIPLPTDLTATLKDGSTADIPVTWNDGGLYDRQTMGTYTFTADIGEYHYDQPLPTALVTVELTPSFMPFASDVVPVIDSQWINGNTKVVVIEEQTGKQSGFNVLWLALQSGVSTGAYTIVFVQDYPISGSDFGYMPQYGKEAQRITFTSRYSNGTSEFRKTVTGTGTWTASADTTLRDVTLSGQIIFLGDGHDLVMDRGIETSGLMSIYGGINVGKYISTNVIIRSGKWADVSPGNISGTLYSDASLLVDGSDGTVDITRSLSLKTTTNGAVTVHLKDVNLTATTIDLTTATTAKLTAEGTNDLTGGDLKVKSEIRLLENASLSLTKKLNPINNVTTAPTLILEAASVLALKDDSGGAQYVKDLDVRGPGAEIQMHAQGVVGVFGGYLGAEKLALNTYGTANAHGKQFFTFVVEGSAVAEHYTTSSPNGLGGILKSSKDILYCDLVVPEYGYTRNQQLKVGGYGDTTEVWRFSKTSDDMAPTQLLSGQLWARMPQFNRGAEFYNYHEYTSPADYIAVHVDGKNYVLTSRPSDKVPGAMAGPYFRGYRYSPDGQTLSFVFYLGDDVGIVYWHTTILPKSLTMEENWEFISLSDLPQTVVVSHANDIAYVGKDMSQAIFNHGSTVATAFHRVTDPAMFMYVNEKTVDVPAVIGDFAGPAPTLIAEALTGAAYTTGRTATSGTTYDTAMGIQWKYRVAPRESVSSSGGTSFGTPGESLQFREGRITISNPAWENATSTLPHTVMNLHSEAVTVTEYEVIGDHPGILVTPHFPSSFDPQNTTSFDFEVAADNTVPPGVYEYLCKVTAGGITYQFTDYVTVKRDTYTITTSAVKRDQTPVPGAIIAVKKVTTAPVAGDQLYKYYDAELSWMVTAGFEIVDILVNGTSLAAYNPTSLDAAKSTSKLGLPEMTSDQKIVFVMRERNGVNLTISKMVEGPYADRARPFRFFVQFQDKTGTILDAGIEIYYTGGIVPGSGATPPADGKQTLTVHGAEFDLQHGQTIIIEEVLTDGKVRVMEALDADYEPSYVDSRGGSGVGMPTTTWIPVNGSNLGVDFTNRHTDAGPVPTGILTGTAQGPVLLAASACLLAAGGLVAGRMRRRPRRGR